MIDLNNLIDYFPYYFKENDSYKVEGKGLLERFLNICGDYFQQYPLADLDNFLENLDVNKTNIIYIQNFWKFFGELPFAQGPIIDADLFTKNFTGFNFDSALKKATRSSEAFTLSDDVDYRSLIKYSVALFKIRGTKRFFDILFRLYNINCTIGEDIIRDDTFLPDINTPFDSEDVLFDKATFDHYYRCKNCSDVTFKFTLNKTATDDIKLSFFNQVKAFVNRFVPFYINPKIELVGWDNLQKVILTVTPDTNLVIGPGENLLLNIKVKPLIEGNTAPSLAYQIAAVDTGKNVSERDWSLETTSPTYLVLKGNQDYYFRPIADKSQVKKVHITEQYTEVGYTIWVDSPKNPEDFIISKNNPEVTLVIKALANITTHTDGVTSKRDIPTNIYWDTADNPGIIGNDGTATVTINKEGPQTFSIAEYRTRKVNVYIGIDEDYKNQLEKITLELDPRYLLVQGNITVPGTRLPSDGDNPILEDGTYSSEDGLVWEPAEFQTTFHVYDADDNEVPDAVITQITNSSKEYHSGDIWIPPTAGANIYQFVATYKGKKSNVVNLIVKNSNSQKVNPVFKSLDVDPNPLQFLWYSGEVTKHLNIKCRIENLGDAAKTYIAAIGVTNSKTLKHEVIYAYYESDSNLGGSIFSTTYSHTINGLGDHTLTFELFNPLENTGQTIQDVVKVEVTKDTTMDNIDLYIQAVGNLTQWQVNDADADEYDRSYVRGKDLTFTSKEGSDESKKIAKFRFEGTYGADVTRDGNTYQRDVDYSFPVDKDEDLEFKAGDLTLTVRLRDFPTIVNISCNPTEASLTPNISEVSTIVTGSTNKSDKFVFTVDGVKKSIDNGEGFEFRTSQTGVHEFVSLDDLTKRATFTVKAFDPTDPNNPLNWPISINISPNSSTIKEGDTIEFTANLKPLTGNYDRNVTWEVSNPAIASILSTSTTGAKLTALGSGTVTVVATTANGYKASATVVIEEVLEHNVTNDIAEYSWSSGAGSGDIEKDQGKEIFKSITLGQKLENHFRIRSKDGRFDYNGLNSILTNFITTESQKPIVVNNVGENIYYDVQYSPTNIGQYVLRILYYDTIILVMNVTVEPLNS